MLFFLLSRISIVLVISTYQFHLRTLFSVFSNFYPILCFFSWPLASHLQLSSPPAVTAVEIEAALCCQLALCNWPVRARTGVARHFSCTQNFESFQSFPHFKLLKAFGCEGWDFGNPLPRLLILALVPSTWSTLMPLCSTQPGCPSWTFIYANS